MGKILLISGDTDIRKTLNELKKETNWTVNFISGAQNFWEIISAMSDETYEFVIIDDDLMRPESDHLIRAIKKIQKNIRIIFLTSDTSIELGQKISQLGIDYYCIKPVVRNDLINSIVSINQLQKRNTF